MENPFGKQTGEYSNPVLQVNCQNSTSIPLLCIPFSEHILMNNLKGVSIGLAKKFVTVFSIK